MGFIKNVAIAFLITFFVLIFITNDKVRSETFEVFNHKIGKSNVRVYQIFVVLIVLICILYSSKLLYKAELVRGLIERRAKMK